MRRGSGRVSHLHRRNTSPDAAGLPPMRCVFLVVVVVVIGCGRTATNLGDRLRPIDAHVVIMKSDASFPEYQDVARTAEAEPDVVAATPFTFTELIASNAYNHASIMVKGVAPGQPARLAPLMIEGSLDALTAPADVPAIVIGDGMARVLHLQLGEDITLQMPIWDPELDPPVAPHRQQFRVGAIFHVGDDEIDDQLAFTNLAAAQAVVGRGDLVTGVELELTSPGVAPAMSGRLRSALGPEYVVMDWKELAPP